jgi:4-alpha-glucanotransferase
VRDHAQARGVRIIGDLPLFVAFDSADAWAHPANFKLAPGGTPVVVAGVPPDYFSPTGQLWGNPVYNWNALRADRFRWWIERVRSTLTLCDWVRIDHFRGLSASWEVPYGSPTAEHGRWVKAPGSALLATLREALGDLPLIAEDLGVITADVVVLRRRFKLPGMRVLQFAFDGQSGNPFLPHTYDTRTVVYTGTHDNDTTRGWYAQTPPDVQDRVRRYLGRDGSDIAWDFIRLAWSSVAEMALAPLQDVLDLGSEARMNYPGRGAGNWTWRIRRNCSRTIPRSKRNTRSSRTGSCWDLTRARNKGKTSERGEPY